MMNRFAFLLLTTCFLLLPAQAQSDDTAAAMEAWMASTQPGENHTYLAGYAGEWSVATTMWMEPGAPPSESAGTASSKMIMDGRYLEGHFKGYMMDMPFEGRSVAAYDNVTGEYVFSWIDTFGTGIHVYRGSREGNVITTATEMTNPMTGEKETHRIVETRISDDEYTMDYYVAPAGGEPYKSMHNVYKRIK